MLSVVFFYVLFLSCCSFALWRGGAPERWGATLEVLAVVLTIVVQLRIRPDDRFQDFSWGIFWVDGAFLASLCLLALAADRFWPIAAAGFQVADMVAHLAKVVAPDILPYGYSWGIQFWGYPKLILFVIGARRHRQRLTRYGKDPAWSRPRPPYGPLRSA